MRLYVFPLLIAVTAICMVEAQPSYLHCARLIDGRGDVVQEQSTIIVDANRVKAVEKGYLEVPSDALFVDLTEHTVMPGFMDMHVHIEGQSHPKRYEMRFRQDPADVALQATIYCKRTLMAGFTTVRDLGGSGVNVSLRNAINKGYIDGPRIFTCEKGIGTTGGHADPTNGMRSDLKKDPGPKEGVINNVEDAYKAVRQRYKNGADVIKITATGGVLSVAKDGQGPQFRVDEVKAIVDAANDYGFVTAAHAHGAEGMKRAVLGGIHSIEHGTFMTNEIMDLMIERGTYYVPTISAGRFVAEKAKQEGFYPSIIVPKALAIGPQIEDTFKKAYEHGVKIAFGTDSGVSYHGDNANEFVYMVDAGMSPMEAILSATKEAAALMRKEGELGVIMPGSFADIVAVKGNPLTEIGLLKKVDFVMKNGVIFKH